MSYDPRDFDLGGKHYSDAALIAAAFAVTYMKEHQHLPFDKAAANVQALMHGEVRVGRWSRDRFLYARGLYAWAFFYVYGQHVTFDKEPDLLRGINATKS